MTRRHRKKKARKSPGQRRVSLSTRDSAPRLGSGGSSPQAPLVALLLLVAAVTTITHWPALSAQALCIDDGPMLVDNPAVRNPSWASAGRFLTEVLEPTTVEGYYHPLSMISLMTDCAMGGGVDDLRPFHRTSLALHVMSTLMVMVLVYQFFGSPWTAAMVALLFGVHPIVAERVTWVTERRTVLNAFLALSCLVFYVRYANKGGWGSYAVALVLLTLSFLAKPTSAILPAMLLLLDFWPMKRLSWRALLEKVPFAAVAGMSVMITAISESRTTGGSFPHEQGLTAWLLVSCHNIVFYLRKILWPADLSLWYPFPAEVGLSDPAVLAGVIGSCVLIVMLIISLRWTRALMIGWLVFAVGFLPTVGGILRVGDIIAANRFVYLSVVGLLLTLAWVMHRLWAQASGQRPPVGRRLALVVVVALVIGFEVGLTRRCLAHWRDSMTLNQYLVASAPNAPKPHVNLAGALQAEGKFEEAIEHYRQALALGLEDPETLISLGSALGMTRQIDEAISHFRRALELKPDYAEAHYNLGIALKMTGQADQAISHYQQALAIKPGYADAHNNLGLELMAQGQLDDAIQHFRQALDVQPDHTNARTNLSRAVRFQKQQRPGT